MAAVFPCRMHYAARAQAQPKWQLEHPIQAALHPTGYDNAFDPARSYTYFYFSQDAGK